MHDVSAQGEVTDGEDVGFVGAVHSDESRTRTHSMQTERLEGRAPQRALGGTGIHQHLCGMSVDGDGCQRLVVGRCDAQLADLQELARALGRHDGLACERESGYSRSSDPCPETPHTPPGPLINSESTDGSRWSCAPWSCAARRLPRACPGTRKSRSRRAGGKGSRGPVMLSRTTASAVARCTSADCGPGTGSGCLLPRQPSSMSATASAAVSQSDLMAGTPLPSPAATLAWPSRRGYVVVRRGDEPRKETAS